MPTALLLPAPREISLTGGSLNLSNLDSSIGLNHNPAAHLFFTGQYAQNALKQYANVEWAIAGGDRSSSLVIALANDVAHPQGYHLSIQSQGIRITGSDLAGAFYGVCTLTQLLQIYGAALPTLEIRDWPDFRVRGVMLDISRDKVPTVETLYRLVDMLAGWKINQLQLYTEHTFAYRDHQIVWENASPMTAEEILSLDAYCRARYIDLVPNQASMGHMSRWLMHKQYLPLAETEVGLVSNWGTKQDYPFSLSPAVPEIYGLLEKLYDELLPNFTSELFNIGGDETFDLGEGRSKALVEAKGKGRVYLDFLLEIYQRVKARGRTMQFWGDIIIEHPELVSEVPKDTIALEWGYEATHNYTGNTELFASSGVPFYVCPGTSSWTSIAGRTDNAIANIRNAVLNGLKNGALGVLNTDWGDLGHWQPLPVSYLGLAYGAALSWGYSANLEIDLPTVLSAFAFQDKAGVMGQLVYDLGNAYQKPGVLVRNGSMLLWIYHFQLAKFPVSRDSAWLIGDSAQLIQRPQQVKDNLYQTLDFIDGVMAKLPDAQMIASDADLVKRELVTAARMLKHGARRALLELNDGHKPELLVDIDEIEAEHRRNWLARNRPGGLEDSAARLRHVRKTYES